MIENGSLLGQTVHSVQQNFPSQRKPQPAAQQNRIPPAGNRINGQTQQSSAPRILPSPCWFCSAMYFNHDCKYRQHRCSLCQSIGHKVGFCNAHQTSLKQQEPFKTTSLALATRKKSRIRCSFHGLKDQLHRIDASQSSQWTTKQSVFQLIVYRMSRNQQDKLIGRPALQPSSLIAHSALGDQINILGQRACTRSFQNALAKGLF